MSDDADKFDGLKFLIQYRRKDDGVRWNNMAAFDVRGPAETYFEKQGGHGIPWEYQLVDLESGECRRQPPPDGGTAMSRKTIQDQLGDIMTWLREPDCIEEASLEWLKDWMDRRPIADLAMVAMLMPAEPSPQENAGLRHD